MLHHDGAARHLDDAMTLANALMFIPAVLLALGTTAFAADDLTLEQVPAAVAQTLRTQAGGAAIHEIEATQEQGVLLYEAEIRKPTGTVSLLIAADGTVQTTESTVDLSAMPVAVQTAARKVFGTTTPTQGETVVTGTVTTYSVEAVIGSDTVEILFAADGSEQSRESEKTDGHDDHHDEGKH